MLSAAKCASSAWAACCQSPATAPHGLHRKHRAFHRIAAHDVHVLCSIHGALELNPMEEDGVDIDDLAGQF